MDKENKGGGFLAGLVIGAAVGALVSTKRGRQILKDLSEYGLDYVGRAINLEDIDTILNEEEEEMMDGEVEEIEEEKEEKEEKAEKKEEKEEEKKEEQPSRRKRLFKGIKK